MKYGILNPLDTLNVKTEALLGGLLFALKSSDEESKFYVSLSNRITDHMISLLVRNNIDKINGFKSSEGNYSSSIIDSNITSYITINALGNKETLSENLNSFNLDLALIEACDVIIAFTEMRFNDTLLPIIESSNKEYYLFNTTTGKFIKGGVKGE